MECLVMCFHTKFTGWFSQAAANIASTFRDLNVLGACYSAPAADIHNKRKFQESGSQCGQVENSFQSDMNFDETICLGNAVI